MLSQQVRRLRCSIVYCNRPGELAGAIRGLHGRELARCYRVSSTHRYKLLASLVFERGIDERLQAVYVQCYALLDLANLVIVEERQD